MNKSLPTVSSISGTPKNKRFTQVWAILACVLVFFGLSVPTAFAGVAAYAAEIVPNAADTSKGGFILQDNTGRGVTFYEQRSNADGSFTTVATHTVAGNPGNLPTTDTSNGYTGLLEGQTIRVVLAGPAGVYQVPTYTRPVVIPPPPVSATPLVPGWNGADVTIPVANGHYEYINTVTGAVLSVGVHSVAVSATLSVSARATQSDTVLTTTGPWVFTHIPPVVQDGDGDGVPDGTDQCPATPAHQSVNQFGCAIGLAPIVTLTGTHNATATSDGSADFTVKNPNEVGITYQVNVNGGGGPTSLSVGAGETATLTINRPSGDYALSLRAAGSVTNPVAFTIGSDVVETTPAPAQAPVLPTFVDTTGKLTVPAQGDNTPNAWTYTVGGTPVSAAGDTVTVTGTVSVVIWLKPGFSYDGHVAPYSITKVYTTTVVAKPVDKPVEKPVEKPAETPASTPQTVAPVQTTVTPTRQHAEQTAATNNRWAPDLAASGTSQSGSSSDGSAGWVRLALFAALVAAGAGLAPRPRTQRVLSK